MVVVGGLVGGSGGPINILTPTSPRPYPTQSNKNSGCLTCGLDTDHKHILLCSNNYHPAETLKTGTITPCPAEYHAYCLTWPTLYGCPPATPQQPVRHTQLTPLQQMEGNISRPKKLPPTVDHSEVSIWDMIKARKTKVSRSSIVARRSAFGVRRSSFGVRRSSNPPPIPC